MSLQQIADKAGVSIATVSRVLNNSRPVNPRIVELVRRTVEELQVQPRQARRRSRVAGRGSTIAIVSIGQQYRGWFEVPVIASVIGELTRAAQDHQMGVLMAEMPDPSQISPTLRRSDIDGAIAFIGNVATTRDLAVLAEHLPVVRAMGGQLAPVDFDHIGPDNNAIGQMAANYLLGHGVRDLAYVTGSPSWDMCKLRAQGFMAAAYDAGITPRTYLQTNRERLWGFFGPNPIVETDLAVLVGHIAKTCSDGRKLGLFVSRDEETVDVYRLLRQEGIEPGKDVVVVSCDNEAVRLSTLHPRPASIELGTAEIARHAIRRLSMRIKHRNEPPVRILVTPRLIPGGIDEPSESTTEAAAMVANVPPAM